MADPTPHKPNEPPEIIYVDDRRIACDGGGVLGHPRVFLNIGDRESVECGYCDRMFVLRSGAETGAGQH
jgi:uncharacterized Zn-finger protein